MAGFCEHGNNSWRCIKAWNFFVVTPFRNEGASLTQYSLRKLSVLSQSTIKPRKPQPQYPVQGFERRTVAWSGDVVSSMKVVLRLQGVSLLISSPPTKKHVKVNVVGLWLLMTTARREMLFAAEFRHVMAFKILSGRGFSGLTQRHMYCSCCGIRPLSLWYP